MPNRQIIKKFFSPIKQVKKYYVVIMIISILHGFWGYFSPRIFSTVVKQFEIAQKTGVFNERALHYTIIFFACVTVWFVTRFLLRNYGMMYRQFTANAIYEKYLKKFFIMDHNAAEQLGTGKLTQIVNTGAGSWTELLDALGPMALRQIIVIGGAFLYVYQINRTYALIAFCISLALVPILIRFVKQTKKHRKARKEISIVKQKLAVKFFMTKFEILQNNKGDSERDSYFALVLKDIGLGKKLKTREFLMFNTPSLVTDYFKTLLFIAATYTIWNGSSNLSEFVGLRTAAGFISNAIGNITDQFERLPDRFVDMYKLRETIDDTPSIIGYSEGKDFAFQKGNIVFHNTSFGYNARKQILDNFSITLEGGTKTALIGSSGAGKTTLVKLIAGYLHPTAGVVSIDGQELPNKDGSNDHINLKSYYQHIGYLTQEPSVFDGSIKENLLYGMPPNQDEISIDKQIQNAIELAQCQFVYTFPDQLDTQIGEKGVKLSGGQKQRLAIAKLMLKNPHIIILDEPTSALDSFAEEEVTKALDNLFHGKTVVIIAHRLQTVKKADRIVVIEDGQIQEDGNHDTLVAAGGIYAKMLELQSGF